VTFNSLATGSTPIQYQWYFNGAALPNATSRQLFLASATSQSAGSYFTVATNLYGRTTSSVAQLVVNQTLVLTQPLSNQVVDAGATVVLVVGATSTNTLGYLWQMNGTSIAGSNSTLTIGNIQPSQSGFYSVIITNPYGSVSSTGRVSVLGPASAVIAWGDNSARQTNVPSNLDDAVAVAGGDFHSIALRHDGSLVGWGLNADGQTTVPTNSQRFVSIAAGAAHNLAITEAGSVIGWGRNDAGQIVVPSVTSNSAVSVAAGDSHSLALLSSGTLLAWGDNSYGQTNVPQGLAGVRAIAAGRNHSLALLGNGTVVGWGLNDSGQATAPGFFTGVAAIAAGYLHSAVLLSNGTVVVWGDNTFDQTNVPPGLSNVTAICAGDYHTIALRVDGSIVGWGDDTFGQLEFPNSSNISAIASGNYHSLALVPALAGLEIARTAGKIIVRWNSSGILQLAPAPTGPFSDVQTQGSSFTNDIISAPAQFYRLRR
jgi:hypothetical protein